MTTRTKLDIAGAALIAVLIGVVAFVWVRKSQAEYDRGIAESNQRAAQDVSRDISTKFDSVANVAARLSLQQPIDERKITGALGEATKQLGLAVKTIQTLTVRVDRLEKAVEAGQTRTATGRLLTFPVVGPPIEGSIRVDVPDSITKPATMTPSLGVSPFAMKVGVGCDEKKDATVAVETPPWIHVTVERGTTEPVVCHGERPRPRFGFDIDWSPKTVTAAAVGAAGGVALWEYVVRPLVKKR